MTPIPVETLINEYLANHEYRNPTYLCALMMTFGSDKGGPRHNYTTLYSKLFNSWKNDEINLFEVGLGTNNPEIPSTMGVNGVPGASLFAWEHYFTNGHFYGADIDKNILFNKGKIRTYYCDQNDDKSIQEMFSDEILKTVNFDIIIDDGYHEFKHNLIFLWNSIHKLNTGGIYIVEDLNRYTKLYFSNALEDLKRTFSLKYIRIVDIPVDLTADDNTLLVIQK